MIAKIIPSHIFTERMTEHLTLKYNREGDFLFFRLKYNSMPIDVLALYLTVYEDPQFEKQYFRYICM